MQQHVPVATPVDSPSFFFHGISLISAGLHLENNAQLGFVTWVHVAVLQDDVFAFRISGKWK